jgi:hypothetical protein
MYMNAIVIVIGLLASLLCLSALILPKRLQSLVKKITVTTRFRLIACAIRITTGISILAVAETTQFPLAFQIIGCAFILKGIVVLLMKNTDMQSLLDIVCRQNQYVVRRFGMLGLLFCGFLIYAVV